MDKDEVSQPIDSKQLRKCLNRSLLNNRSLKAVTTTLRHWESEGWQPLLFGGFIRDLAIQDAKSSPRDVDVVFAGQSLLEMKSSLAPHIQRENRFGGLQLQLEKWHFDVWPLQATWAFSHCNLLPTKENLPKTTFLNIEAIAVSVTPEGLIGDIYENGFFAALSERVLDINFEENPFPALAAVRAINIAAKLRFSLTPRLAAYVVRIAEHNGTQAFIAAQEKHYGKVPLTASRLTRVLVRLKAELERGVSEPVQAGALGDTQLMLWSEEGAKVKDLEALRNSLPKIRPRHT